MSELLISAIFSLIAWLIWKYKDGERLHKVDKANQTNVIWKLCNVPL